MKMTRRNFIRAAGVAAVFTPALTTAATSKAERILPNRVLGSTGEKVTAFGLGGYHVGVSKDEKKAEALIERAMERGVRFFDNAVQYQEGLAETFYGKFLCPKYRDQVFLMTKSSGTTPEAVRKDLDDSLRRMSTDHLDLWQMHAFVSVEDVKKRIANGVVDVFLEAREKKKTRFIGFTGHSSQEAHSYFIDWCVERGFRMDTCQMPVNVFDPHYDSFLIQVEPKLRKQKIALLAMKTMAFGRAIERAKEMDPSIVTPKNLHEFVYSLPVACLISGCETVEQIDQNTSILEDFKPMTEDRRKELIESVKPMAGQKIESYKRKV
jgi:aryl-alcohol dehydrogenase-like predicted oxidoreductase